MKPIHGKLLMATGVLHSGIVAPLVYWEKWRQFFGQGLFDVSPHTRGTNSVVEFADITAEAAVWFFIGGILFFLAGHLMHALEVREGQLPRFVGWELLAIGGAFAWMMPSSGFTVLVIPQALFILIRSKKG